MATPSAVDMLQKRLAVLNNRRAQVLLDIQIVEDLLAKAREPERVFPAAQEVVTKGK